MAALVPAGCGTRGSAPVYNRTLTDPPERVSRVREPPPRPPVYPRSYYLVQPGDTLYSIAWRQNLTYQQIAGWNGITPPGYQIFPGQRLRLKPPAMRHAAPSAPKAPRPTAPTHASPKPASTVSIRKIPAAERSPKPASSGKTLKLVWDWPTKGRVVQTFSPGDDNRKGIWIHGQMGQPVSAAEAGKVVYAGNGLVGYGNLIIVKHDQRYLSAYGYNSKLLVSEGDTVRKGEVLAKMGVPNTGGQPVLHFEIRRQGKPVNPLPLLPKK